MEYFQKFHLNFEEITIKNEKYKETSKQYERNNTKIIKQVNSCNLKVFNEDLNFISILTTNQSEWLVTGNNDKIIVGDDINGKVYFYVYNLMIIILPLCETLSKELPDYFHTCNPATFLNFDSKNRFIL
jgi:hypothetical protein